MSKISVVIPCYNEEKTIAKVVGDFRRELPEAEIIVIDNNSTDNSVDLAREAGAKVLFEKKQGKGNVVKSMFDNIIADIYVMVDGDATYSANEIHKLIKPVLDGEADMVVGNRLKNMDAKSIKPLHQFGNRAILFILNLLFRTNLQDILSGYRVMNDKFVKNIPLLSEGFEIETELTLQALEKGYKIKEIPITYYERPFGSQSKLHSFRDGSKILFTIMSILRDYRPMTFFPLFAAILVIIGLILGGIVFYGYYKTGLVFRLPMAILAVSFIIIAFITFIAGFITETINRRFKELHSILKRQIKK